ncbi:hypothetical protein [Ensifer sp. SL37]|uniref:hypothetical protein n=1 Tax=Ensifer sp. SL37 TaxID=2995137 RepID=UPI002275F932|nr:hypothetical protein [Ensifer sp. SL37]MCY1740745.1 hypothetical protein [Ensifer sp. SL37]
MRQVREILKLRLDVGLSGRVIAQQLGVGETSVRDTLKPAATFFPLPALREFPETRLGAALC